MDTLTKEERSRVMSRIRSHRHEGCPVATTPKSNLEFWNAKFELNVARDLGHEAYWAEHGWNVVVVWECGLRKKSREETLPLILHHLERFGVEPGVAK